MEKVDWPRTVAEESNGIWRMKLLGVMVMLDVKGGPVPEGGDELSVPEEGVPEEER
jgi:hypothetical protein